MRIWSMLGGYLLRVDYYFLRRSNIVPKLDPLWIIMIRCNLALFLMKGEFFEHPADFDYPISIDAMLYRQTKISCLNMEKLFLAFSSLEKLVWLFRANTGSTDFPVVRRVICLWNNTDVCRQCTSAGSKNFGKIVPYLCAAPKSSAKDKQ